MHSFFFLRSVRSFSLFLFVCFTSSVLHCLRWCSRKKNVIEEPRGKRQIKNTLTAESNNNHYVRKVWRKKYASKQNSRECRHTHTDSLTTATFTQQQLTECICTIIQYQFVKWIRTSKAKLQHDTEPPRHNRAKSKLRIIAHGEPRRLCVCHRGIRLSLFVLCLWWAVAGCCWICDLLVCSRQIERFAP